MTGANVPAAAREAIPPQAITDAAKAGTDAQWFVASHAHDPKVRQQEREAIMASAIKAAAPHVWAAALEWAAQQRDGVYAERDRLVAALSKHYSAHLCRHEGDAWEDEWRNIVCIHLPTGQATWHVHISELPWFRHLPTAPAHWDGHSTGEKYARLARIPDIPGRASLLRQGGGAS